MKVLLGKKLGMTQVFAHDTVVPVTVIEAGPCFVTQVKTEENDGYTAVQIGYGQVKDKKVTKPLKKHFDKAKVKPARYLAEYRIEKQEDQQEAGTKLTCSIFETGELANISSVSKGKGFQGVIKRWGFSGGPGGHGSHFHRTAGSIGMAATPSRVQKGMKMAGRMGGEQVTTKNLEIVKVDESQNLILVKGAVAGGKGALLMIKTIGKNAKNPIKLAEIAEEKPAKDKKEKKEEQAAKGEEQAVEKDKKEAAKTEEKSEKQTPDVSSQSKEEKKEVVADKKTEVKAKQEKEIKDQKKISNSGNQKLEEKKQKTKPGDQSKEEVKDKEKQTKEKEKSGEQKDNKKPLTDDKKEASKKEVKE